MQLALVAQDADNCVWLCGKLEAAGYRVSQFERLQEIRRERCRGFAAIVLDLGTRCPDAASCVEPIRKSGVTAPILVLNVRDAWRERVDCLEVGADDYLVKPVRSEEVLARLKAIIRRNLGSATNQIVRGDLVIDLDRRCAWLSGECLDLTRNEFRLLRILTTRPDMVVPQQEIREALYGSASPSGHNALEVLVARLRRKLGSDRIRTVRGMGYRYADAESSAASGPVTGAGQRA